MTSKETSDDNTLTYEKLVDMHKTIQDELPEVKKYFGQSFIADNVSFSSEWTGKVTPEEVRLLRFNAVLNEEIKTPTDIEVLYEKIKDVTPPSGAEVRIFAIDADILNPDVFNIAKLGRLNK